MRFAELSKWNWEKNQTEGPNNGLLENENLREQESEEEGDDLGEDPDYPVRGVRTMDDVYARCNLATLEPVNYVEAAEIEGWRVAMEEEINMIEKNKTWQLVDRPINQKVIGVKWVYRTKLNVNGFVNRLKARLVVKGYFQQHGVDFSDTFAPVARHDTIRLLAAMAAKMGWKIYHLDVKSAFLNGLLEEEIYVEQPEGFQVPKKWKQSLQTS